MEIRWRRRRVPQHVAIFGANVRDDASLFDAGVSGNHIRPVLAELGLDD